MGSISFRRDVTAVEDIGGRLLFTREAMRLIEELLRRVEPSGTPPGAVTPTGSPYPYTASEDGMLYVGGGTVTAIVLTRGGSVAAITATAGSFLLRAGDRLSISYSAAPSMTWVPK